MKNILLITIFFALLSSNVFSKIGDVILKNKYAYIYDENGKQTGRSIMVANGEELSGFNSSKIVITLKDYTYAYIYNEFGQKLENLRLGNGKYIKNVTESNIIVQNKSFLEYYDFKGNLIRSHQNK